MKKIEWIYQRLLEAYGHQGWWPLTCRKGSNPTKTGSLQGYHPGDYSLPETTLEVFEICIGAVLTQNVGWTNVEKALVNLKKLNATDPRNFLETDVDLLKDAIRPAGYFNQKSKKLIAFTEFFLSLDGKSPSREDLLNIWGIGRETADSMLLYAYKKPIFVIDAYTRRIFSRLEIIDEKTDYDEIRTFFEKNLPQEPNIYQEYHALIVEHAKRYYSKKPYGINCPL